MRWTTAWLLGVALAAAAAPPKPPAGDAQMTHTIQRGETIWSLSRRYGVSVEAIVEANQIRDVRRVHAGRALRIPLAERFKTPPLDPEPSETLGSQTAEEPEPIASSGPGEAAEVPDVDELEALLAQAEGALREARFEEALETVEVARRALEPREDAETLRAYQARLEVIAGTAEVALTRYGDAMASFGRALTAEPGLRLDPVTTSPKVVRVFDEARARAQEEAAPVPGLPE